MAGLVAATALAIFGSADLALAQGVEPQAPTSGDRGTDGRAAASMGAPGGSGANAGASSRTAQVVEANERVARGENLFDAGDFDAALSEFERAYEVIGDHPARFAILYNIAKAHERRFRYDLAMAYYRRYLEQGGEHAPDAAAVRATISALEGLLATIEIEVRTTALAGADAAAAIEAEVWIGDRQVGVAPSAVLIPGGRHILEVRAPGHLPARREVQIPPRSTTRLSITLEPVGAAYSGLDSTYFFVTGAAALACIGAGAVFGGLALDARADVDQRLGDPAERWGDFAADRRRIEELSLVADLFFGGALLLGTGAVILAVMTDFGGSGTTEAPGRTSRGPRADRPAVALSPWFGRGDAGLGLSGSF